MNEPFIIERTFNAPVEKVWKAITDKDQMKEWYFDIAEFKPEVGFEFQFYGQGHKGEKYLHLCKITEVIQNKKLSYSWRYDGYPGSSQVIFELFAEGNGTRLKLTHEGLETFSANGPDFAKESFSEGWTYLIGTSIRELVESATIEKSVQINASPSKVWSVLIDSENSSQWANEFSEGAYVESEWKNRSVVEWKDKDGNIGAKGVVTSNEPNRLLKVSFYDDVNISPGEPLGAYAESYGLEERNGKTVLSISAGPLALRHVNAHSPLWDKAIGKIKSLAEV